MPHVTLRFRHEHAGTVSLAGDFNNWSTTAHPMRRAADGSWIIEVSLPPGRQEYKFLVDGKEWWNDPGAPKTPNLWGTENSYLDVRAEG
jgi:1,4-alpha-glucan branching enzyme